MNQSTVIDIEGPKLMAFDGQTFVIPPDCQHIAVREYNGRLWPGKTNADGTTWEPLNMAVAMVRGRLHGKTSILGRKDAEGVRRLW